MARAVTLTSVQIMRMKATNPRGERVYDAVRRGLGLAAYPSGKKTFFVEYGSAKRRRRMKLGEFGPLTLEQARKRAEILLGQIAAGVDPLDERAARAAIPTLREWAATYLALVKERKRTWRADHAALHEAVAMLGRKQLSELSVDDVVRLVEQWKATGARVSPNRKLASLRACLQEAWRRQLVPENVARRVRLMPEPSPRQRVLSTEEMQRLLAAINELPHASWRAALLLLVQTGARQGEVLSARWSDIDLANGVWNLPHPKSGKPQAIPLLDESLNLIRELPRAGTYVIPGADPEKRRADLHQPWRTACRLASLRDVRLHDLRRTYGLDAARTAGLHLASRLLRHSTIALTARVYAPFQLDEVRAAAEQVAAARRSRLR